MRTKTIAMTAALLTANALYLPVVAQMQPQASIPPAPPPTTPDARNFGPWPVGLWRRGAACKGAVDYLRIHKSGRYESSSDAGSWTLAGNRLTFSHRDTGPNATSAMERRAANRSRVATVKRLTPTTMTLNNAQWTRCSPDPELFID